MVKRFGHSAAAAALGYIRDNSQVLRLTSTAPASYSAAANEPQLIVSANVSATDFTLASGASGPTLTLAAKSGQAIHGSGTATHAVLTKTSGTALLYVVNVSAQVLSSGNTVNTGALVITMLTSANNA